MSGTDPLHTAWFEKAEHDLEMIRRAMVADGAPWDMVTFHAQQAAEKYLKGFLVARGSVVPKIHDLVALRVPKSSAP